MLPIAVYLKEHDKIDAQVVRKLTGKSRATAFRYLQKLVDLGIVECEGFSASGIYRRK